MTAANYPHALKLVLVHEGGFVNHPKDPGGATMKGVTQVVYDAFRQARGEPKRSVKLIAAAEINAIYEKQYWDRVSGDALPTGLDYAVFDYAVNSGSARAIKDLQRTLNANANRYGIPGQLGVDGMMGVRTIQGACAAASADEEGLIEAYCQRRMRFLKSLKTWKTFGKGWKRRVIGDMDEAVAGDAGVQDFAILMARKDLTYPIPKAQLPAPIGAKVGEVAGKGVEAQQAQLKTAEGFGVTAAACGAGGEKVRQFAESVQPHMGMETMLGRLAFAVFTLLMLIGGVLIGYAYLRRIKEKGGLGGFLGSVFKEAT